ncbi:MAG: helix-turn-helix transcriptional regulator [Planctomycetes bacterium]|nr:helix-turn-helix transcriptional regulator [Planctomycetota bacterium]
MDNEPTHECLGEEHTGNGVPVQLPDPLVCSRTAAIFRALGDVSRLSLLSLLAQREMCVSELTESLSDNLPAISQRLKLLRSERIVRSRRQGKHVYYSLADNHIAQLISNGLEHGSEEPYG